jgi:hypothetical protein
MPNRYRVLVLALVLILSAHSGQAQEQDENGQRAAEDEQSQPQILPFRVPVEIIESDASAGARQRLEGETKEREIRDLAAQEGMNRATQAMNDATQRMAQYAFWSTLIVAIGTPLLVWNLLEIRRANRAAFGATKAANDANLISRHEQRPWLTLRATSFSIHQFDDGTPAIKFGFDVNNVGKSPAKILDWGFTIFIDDKDAARSEILSSAIKGTPSWVLPERVQDLGRLEPTGNRATVLARESQFYSILFLVRYTDAGGDAEFETENIAALKRQASDAAGSYTLRLGNFGQGDDSQSSEERYT